MLETDLYSHLKTYSDLTDYVSTRIYPRVAPQNVTIPYVTYFLVDAIHEQAVDRTVVGHADYMQFDSWSDDYKQAKNIALELENALLAYTTSTYQVAGLEQRDLPYEWDTGLYHVAVEAFILHS